MPKAPRYCPEAGCTNLIKHEARCPEHQPEPWQGRTTGQGSTHAWRKTRQLVLERDRYQCRLAYAGCTRHATTVDHVVNIASLRIARRDAFDPADCVAACTPCHRAKTQAEAAAARNRP